MDEPGARLPPGMGTSETLLMLLTAVVHFTSLSVVAHSLCGAFVPPKVKNSGLGVAIKRFSS